MLTKSKRQTCESSETQEDLAADRSRTAVTRVEWRGEHMEYTTHGGFRGFGPQNPDGGSEEWTTRGGIEELTPRQSYLIKGAVAVGSRLCRVRLKCPCG